MRPPGLCTETEWGPPGLAFGINCPVVGVLKLNSPLIEFCWHDSIFPRNLVPCTATGENVSLGKKPSDSGSLPGWRLEAADSRLQASGFTLQPPASRLQPTLALPHSASLEPVVSRIQSALPTRGGCMSASVDLTCDSKGWVGAPGDCPSISGSFPASRGGIGVSKDCFLSTFCAWRVCRLETSRQTGGCELFLWRFVALDTFRQVIGWLDPISWGDVDEMTGELAPESIVGENVHDFRKAGSRRAV